jgi:hypothetical protein
MAMIWIVALSFLAYMLFGWFLLRILEQDPNGDIYIDAITTIFWVVLVVGWLGSYLGRKIFSRKI